MPNYKKGILKVANTNPAVEAESEAKQFSSITLATTMLFMTVGSIALFMTLVFSSPVAKGLAVLIVFLLFPLSLLAHLQARKGNLNQAVLMMSIAWYAIAAGMIVVGERLYGVLIVTATMPVLMTLPFVSQRILRRLIIASIILIFAGSVGALFPPVITPTVPDKTVAYVQSFATAVISCVVMLSLWQSAGKLKAAAIGMREAIVALQQSEKSLELKVDERTAEVEQAFREISDINAIANIVNSTLDVNEVKDTIYNGLQSMFKFDQMGVFLVDERDGRLHLKLQAGRPFPDTLSQHLIEDGMLLDANDSFAAASVVTNQSIFTGAITPEGVAQSSATNKLVLEHNPIASLLLCPLQIENRSIGCMFFAAQEEAFDLSEKEIGTIENYVTQLGTAIRNAQLFQAAEASRNEAQAANDTKGTFLANMSHEIRTPMNAIIGLTGLCLDTQLNSKQEDYLTKVDAAANALRTIIDDILDFSKLEAGKFEFENIPFSLNDVLDNLATISMVRCRDKQLELVFQRDPGLPDMLTGDPTRLGQILINLAGNAIKFTEEGQIVVEVRQVGQTQDRVSVAFDVRDSGIGMSEEQLGRLFQSFSQADSTISRQYGGTGLGLAISQQLSEMMGGKIEVTSEPGVGSSFHFTLEFDVADVDTERVDRGEVPQGLNVLVVDDNEPSRDILREYLESFGYTVALAESGEEALQAMVPDHGFDLVLLDWMMPGMTGLDVALAIRETKSPPKVVLLSSWVMPSSEHEALVDAFLAKPVKPSSLLDTIMQAYGKQVVRRKRSLGLTTGPEDLAAIQGARVLVVDDSDINLQIACELLDKIPLVHETASDGEEAVEKIRSNSYDCVLMDIQMPGMDGYTATGMIREGHAYDDLPIMAMTANVMAEDRARTKEAGMQGHVAKPVDPAELYLALLENIKPGDYTANLPCAEEISAAKSTASQHAPLPDFLPGLDIKQGLGRLGNNENLLVRLLTDLMAQYGDAASKMQQLVAQDQQDELRAAAHKLRGIAVNLGAVDVGAGAEAIEQTVLSAERVTERQLAGLAEAIAVLGQSHTELLAGRSTGPATEEEEGIDAGKVFAGLKAAVATSDPAATDLVEQLLSTVGRDTELSQLLTRARDYLDNFSFPEAELLLAEIEEGLSGAA